MSVVQYNIPTGLCFLRNNVAFPEYPIINFIVGPHVFECTTFDIVLSAGTLMAAKQFKNDSAEHRDMVEYGIMATNSASAYRDYSKSGGEIREISFNQSSDWSENVTCCQSTTGISPFSDIVTVIGSELYSFANNLIGGEITKGHYAQSTFSEQSGWDSFAYKFPDTWAATTGNYNTAKMPYYMLAPVLYGGTIPAQSYPITYRLTNATTTGPNEAAVGDTVTVPLTFPEGYGIVNPSSDAYVTCNGVLVPSTYSNGQLVFTMPDPS